jgi:hypothetical protein
MAVTGWSPPVVWRLRAEDALRIMRTRRTMAFEQAMIQAVAIWSPLMKGRTRDKLFAEMGVIEQRRPLAEEFGEKVAREAAENLERQKEWLNKKSR